MIFFRHLIKVFFRFIILSLDGPEGGSSSIEDTQTQELIENFGDILDEKEEERVIPKDIEEILLNEDIWNTEKGDQKENLQKFQDYLLENPLIASDVLESIKHSSNNGEELGDYIYGNGFIINDLTYQAFAKKFNINLLEQTAEKQEQTAEKQEQTAEKQEQTAEKQEQTAEKQEQTAEKLNKNFRDFEKLAEKYSGSDKKIIDFIKRSKNLDVNYNNLNGKEKLKLINDKEKLIDDIEEYLKKPGVIQTISQELYDSGDKQSYESFKSFAVGLDSSFGNEFVKFEESLKGTEKDPVVEAMSMSGLIDTSNVVKNGSILSSKFDGKEVMIDTGDIPHSRYLKLEGSDYNLETELPIGNFYKAIANEGLEYEKAVKNMNSSLSVMKMVESVKIEAEDYEKESFNTLILGISQSTGTDLNELRTILSDNGITSNEGLKYYIENKGFSRLENKLKQEVEQKKKAYQYALKDQIKIYKDLLVEQDRKTEGTLSSIHKIGFDLIPQGISDDIIGTLNSNNTIKLLGFQSKIDIANGNLGTNFDNDVNKISIKEIQKFTELMNIMITGNKDYPVVIDSLTSIGKPVFENEKGDQISDANLKIFINDKLGGNPKSRAMLNIEDYLKSGDRVENNKIK